MSAIQEAAERVRVARTMAAWRGDEESTTELIEALEALRKLMVASRVLREEDAPENFGNPDFKGPTP